MQRKRLLLVWGKSPNSTPLFCRMPRRDIHHPYAQQNTREKKIIWYPAFRHCDMSVPSAALLPILTLCHTLHKILKARKNDPIGYLLVINQDCLSAPQ
jgi:hypothetical protein